MATDLPHLPVLVPVDKPLSLIPVALKEAALDSPTFRATVVHYCDQIDLVERWLSSYVQAATKLSQEVSVLENVTAAFLTTANPPAQLSEAVIDHDYTLLAMRRCREGARDFWTHAIGGFKKTQHTIVDPIKAALQNDFRPYKDARRQLESTQKLYDGLLARYFSQTKTKEASSLREDAFQLHEARRSYLKASMDFCIVVPQFRTTLDSLLIKVFSDQWLEMKDLRETRTTSFDSHGGEIRRIRAWSRELLPGDKLLRRELNAARKDIEESAELAARPSRGLDLYTSVQASHGAHSPAVRPQVVVDGVTSVGSKQGWLFMRTYSGKPARTYWVRRWFFVKGGIFGWLIQGPRSGGVEESEKIGVLLCSVRPASQEERRFCFEIKTKDTTILLQAETQADLTLWLSTFDVAKRKALEEPTLTDSILDSENSSSDAAFAVSPAIAPELAAKRPDGQLASINDEASSALSGIDHENATPRASVEVSSNRRNTIDKDSEGGRDHTNKLLQKLDMHRKSNTTAPTSAGAEQPAAATTSYMGGISNLISASHAALPASLGGPQLTSVAESQVFMGDDAPPTSLAPGTFVNPPAPTNLSKTAIIVAMDRGFDLGVVDPSGGVPSSLMANQWGTANYGYVSRLDRGELDLQLARRLSQSGLKPNRRSSDPATHSDIPTSSSAAAQPVYSTGSATRSSTSFKPGHRKTGSEVEGSGRPRAFPHSVADFPDSYPQALKKQDSQLRMLFPNISRNDRVLLVFRASWNPDEQHDLPGRVYVTMNDMYFYSHHMGFVLVSGVSLSTILDVSSTPHQRQDSITLRLEQTKRGNTEGLISITTYLEPLQLLQRRLAFLVSNAKSQQPKDLEETLQFLLNMESENLDSRSSLDSWEVAPNAQPVDPSQVRERIRPSLRVDRSLFGGDSASFVGEGDVTKFKLPTQAVTYAPKDMTKLAAERIFEVSTKALFHIMFGDKSVLSQMLYFQRRTQSIKQYPWTAIDVNHWTRKFEYSIDALDKEGDLPKVVIVDSQTVDVANDHLCYVVTDMKTPWHLPRAADFSLVTKIVITHVAKSRSKLAIYTKVDWHTDGGSFQGAIESHAHDDLQVDADRLVHLVNDQVQKLGANCQTNKAISIFGHIGQTADASQMSAPDPSMFGNKETIDVISHQTMPSLVLESAISHGVSGASTLVVSLIEAARVVVKPLTAHVVLLILLVASIAVHAFGTSHLMRSWWIDRRTAEFMSRIGVAPNTVMSRSVYLHDMYDFALPSTTYASSNHSNLCTNAFDHLAHGSGNNVDALISGSASYSSLSTSHTARRLQRARQRLGMYRHDLLLSLKLINNIEKETVQAEYENWLVEETSKCRQLGVLLRSDKGRDLTGSSIAKGGEGGKERAEKVREWWERYCGDCETGRDAVFAFNVHDQR